MPVLREILWVWAWRCKGILSTFWYTRVLEELQLAVALQGAALGPTSKLRLNVPPEGEVYQARKMDQTEDWNP